MTKVPSITPEPPYIEDPLIEWLPKFPPATKRRSYVLSRTLVTDEGKTMTVLSFLALAKWGVWDETKYFPYWKDGDHHNETIDNVERGEYTMTGTGRKTGNRYGAPSHSAAYRRKYHQENKEKIAASQKRYHQRKRAAYAAVRGLDVMEEIEPEGVLDGQERNAFLDRLEAIVEGKEDSASPEEPVQPDPDDPSGTHGA